MKKGNYKKILASIMAGSMALTLMPMTAFATENKISLDVNVDVVDTVVRVQVPTYMAVSIDEFEQEDAGSQIYSTDFEIKNLGSTAVKVNVDSTFATSANVNYVETIDSISGNNDAWIGAVAAVSNTNGYTYSTTTGGVADLTDASTNVASVVSDNGKYVAKQSFYLDAASGSTATYKIVSGTELADSNMRELNYAQFYQLTSTDEATFVTGGAFDKAKLLEIVEGTGSNVLYAVSGSTIHRIDKDDVYENIEDLDDLYNTVSGITDWYKSTEQIATVTSGNTYVYAQISDTPSDKGVASFRYIGKLKKKDSANWDNNAITKVNISYTIKCLSKTEYNDVKDDLTLGYTASASGRDVAPTFALNTSTGVITYTEGSGSLALDESKYIVITGIYKGGSRFNITKAYDVLWSDATIDSTNNTVQLNITSAKVLLSDFTDLNILYNATDKDGTSGEEGTIQ